MFSLGLLLDKECQWTYIFPGIATNVVHYWLQYRELTTLRADMKFLRRKEEYSLLDHRRNEGVSEDFKVDLVKVK
jgi:hypothetical protein